MSIYDRAHTSSLQQVERLCLGLSVVGEQARAQAGIVCEDSSEAKACQGPELLVKLGPAGCGDWG